MSIVVCVLLRDAEVPCFEDLQRALDEAGSGLRLENLSLRTHTGFWPALLTGCPCGFEYSFGPIDADFQDDLQLEIGDRDRVVDFVWHSNELDKRAALHAAAALAKLTNGFYFDPQGGEFAQGERAYQLLEQQEIDERDRRMRLAEKKWGNTTSGRCPKCGAACPEYKKRCSVCDHEVGRVTGA
jgi:hypothetical protein